jgi:hypothetical protein
VTFVGEILDDPGVKVVWRALSWFRPEVPLYPEGLADLLRQSELTACGPK